MINYAAYRREGHFAHRLHLADGDVIDVRHQEFVTTSPSGRKIVVFGEGDEMSIVDLLLASRIEMINGASVKP